MTSSTPWNAPILLLLLAILIQAHLETQEAHNETFFVSPPSPLDFGPSPLLTGKNLPVPYINQRWDTPDDFGGTWACGAASTVMAIAYYRKLPPHPIHCSLPSPHTSRFGWYVSSLYTSPTGVVFDRAQPDSNGKSAFGAFGACSDHGGAWAWRIQNFAKDHALKTEFHEVATLKLLIESIDAGHVILLSTQLTATGHLILIRGYTPSGDLIANDPWGNALLPGWPSNGNGVIYPWSFVKARYCLVFQSPELS